MYDTDKKVWITIAESKDSKSGHSYATCSVNITGRKYKTLRVANEVAKLFLNGVDNSVIKFSNGNYLDCKVENLIVCGKATRRIKIACYLLEFEEDIVEVFDSITKAAETVNTTVTSVSEVINKNLRILNTAKPYTSSGYVFRAI